MDYAAVVVGAVVLIAAVVLFMRRDTGYKVDEFARARSLTTEWARRSGGLATPWRNDNEVPASPRDNEGP